MTYSGHYLSRVLYNLLKYTKLNLSIKKIVFE